MSNTARTPTPSLALLAPPINAVYPSTFLSNLIALSVRYTCRNLPVEEASHIHENAAFAFQAALWHFQVLPVLFMQPSEKSGPLVMDLKSIGDFLAGDDIATNRGTHHLLWNGMRDTYGDVIYPDSDAYDIDEDAAVELMLSSSIAHHLVYSVIEYAIPMRNCEHNPYVSSWGNYGFGISQKDDAEFLLTRRAQWLNSKLDLYESSDSYFGQLVFGTEPNINNRLVAFFMGEGYNRYRQKSEVELKWPLALSRVSSNNVIGCRAETGLLGMDEAGRSLALGPSSATFLSFAKEVLLQISGTSKENKVAVAVLLNVMEALKEYIREGLALIRPYSFAPAVASQVDFVDGSAAHLYKHFLKTATINIKQRIGHKRSGPDDILPLPYSLGDVVLRGATALCASLTAGFTMDSDAELAKRIEAGLRIGVMLPETTPAAPGEDASSLQDFLEAMDATSEEEPGPVSVGPNVNIGEGKTKVSKKKK